MTHVLLTIQQAAQHKGVSTATIYSAIARKRLPRRYSRGNLVVREADLLVWEAEKKPGGRPKGQAVSDEHKARISAAQKKRWAEKRQDETRHVK